MVAGGGLAVAGAGGFAFAFADAEAGGQAVGSPGVLSGNLLQLPVHAPVNVCGNTVSVVGVLNSATGNRCVNASQGGGNPGQQGHPGPGPSHPSKPGAGNGAGNGSGNGGQSGPGRGAVADGRGKDSPGLLSGNGLQLPVEVPLNVSGNAVSVVGVGNSSVGNTSVNGRPPVVGKPVQPPVQPPVRPPVAVRPVTPPAPQRNHPSALAHTGSEGVGYLLSGGGAMLLGGVLLYRRFRLN
ncbi:chaplin [Streptomyces sp. NPDC002104]